MAAGGSRTQEQGQIEANKRIGDALKNRAASLDLSDLGLTALPEAICLLTRLQSRVVYRNRLTVLPEAIGQLTQLAVTCPSWSIQA